MAENNKIYITANELAEMLGVSVGHAYKLIRKLNQELEKEGFSPKVTTYNFCTNGSHYAGEAGIRTIGMGPARENLAHTIDEYAEVKDLTNMLVCYAGIMKALLG